MQFARDGSLPINTVLTAGYLVATLGVRARVRPIDVDMALRADVLRPLPRRRKDRIMRHLLTSRLGHSLLGVTVVLLAAGTFAAAQGPFAPLAGDPFAAILAKLDDLAKATVSEPIQIRLCHAEGVGSCGTTPDSFVVPAGRSLVIEYVSGQCTFSNFGFRLQLQTTASGVFAPHTLELHESGIVSGVWEVTQQTRIYADTGSFIRLVTPGGSSGPSFHTLCPVTVSGYTIAS